MTTYTPHRTVPIAGLIAGELGRHHSSVWKVLQRHGFSRPQGTPREAAHRYEWPCPGDLLHMDTKRYARFERPGHTVEEGVTLGRVGPRPVGLPKRTLMANADWRPPGLDGVSFDIAVTHDSARMATRDNAVSLPPLPDPNSRRSLTSTHPRRFQTAYRTARTYAGCCRRP